jgi:hypothetical protein
MARGVIKGVCLALLALLVVPGSGQARVIKPLIGVLNQRMPLTCWIDNNHMLNVGSAYALRKGTRIYFTAKLENAGTYARTLPLPHDIPAHLSVRFTGLPLFDINADCEAWWYRRPVVAPPR